MERIQRRIVAAAEVVDGALEVQLEEGTKGSRGEEEEEEEEDEEEGSREDEDARASGHCGETPPSDKEA